jgi:predicted dehydrogenase
MAREIRWGIYGTGWVAGAFAAAVQSVDGARTAAVCSRTPENADRFAREHGIPVVHHDYAGLLGDPGVDIVYIAVPHVAHFAAALAAIDAGKAVLLEKPFTVNEREALTLFEHARARGVFLMEAMWNQFLPHFQRAKAIVADGGIGQVRTVWATHGIRFDPEQKTHRMNARELGGGALLDLGVYAVAFVAAFLGEIAEMRTLVTLTDTGVDAELSCVMVDEAGRHGIITTSLSTGLDNRAAISGTSGRIELAPSFVLPNDLTFVSFAEGVPAPGYWGRADAESISIPVAGSGRQFQIEEAGRCVRSGLVESPMMPFQFSRKVMHLMDGMRQQAGISYPNDDPALQEHDAGRQPG